MHESTIKLAREERKSHYGWERRQRWAAGRRRRWCKSDDVEICNRIGRWAIGFLKQQPFSPGGPCLHRWIMAEIFGQFAALFDRNFEQGRRNRTFVHFWASTTRSYLERRLNGKLPQRRAELVGPLQNTKMPMSDDAVDAWLTGIESLFAYHSKRGTVHDLCMSLPLEGDSTNDDDVQVNSVEMADWLQDRSWHPLRDQPQDGLPITATSAVASGKSKKKHRLNYRLIGDNQLGFPDRLVYSFARQWDYANQQRTKHGRATKRITINRFCEATGYRSATVKNALRTLRQRSYLAPDFTPLPFATDLRQKGYRRCVWEANGRTCEQNVFIEVMKRTKKKVNGTWGRMTFGVSRATWYRWRSQMGL